MGPDGKRLIAQSAERINTLTDITMTSKLLLAMIEADPSVKENVKNAFDPISNMVKDKNVLLVDDVITTGATLDSASQALLVSGAKSIYAVTLARAASLSQT